MKVGIVCLVAGLLELLATTALACRFMTVGVDNINLLALIALYVLGACLVAYGSLKGEEIDV